MNQDAEDILNSIFKAFELQKNGEKIYVIIDEYDHFANELLGFYPNQFKDLVSKNGKIRKWYEILKEGTENVVDRIFITGVAPITLDSLTSGFNIGKDITQDSDFNEMMGFTNEQLISLMDNQEIAKEEQEKILPIIKELYSEYFLEILTKQVDFRITENAYNEIIEELALEGKIDKIIELEQKYLTNLSNRDFQRFDEKYIKLIFYCIAMNLKIYNVKSEMEVERKYPDITLIPTDRSKGYNAIIVEFKYLKKGEENQLKEKQEEAKRQIEEYNNTEEMKSIEKLNKYTVVVVVDKIYIEKI